MYAQLKRYFWNLLIAIDQLANTILLGSPDETISSRLGKWRREEPFYTWRWKVSYVVCRILHVLDPEHCRNSIEEDEGSDSIIRRKQK